MHQNAPLPDKNILRFILCSSKVVKLFFVYTECKLHIAFHGCRQGRYEWWLYDV